jgi:hypothetical protein
VDFTFCQNEPNLDWRWIATSRVPKPGGDRGHTNSHEEARSNRRETPLAAICDHSGGACMRERRTQYSMTLALDEI